MKKKLPPLVDESWREIIEPLLDMPEMDIIRGLLGLKDICPVNSKVFRAFSLPFDKVKVVMLGLSPYNGSIQRAEKRDGKPIFIKTRIATGIAMGSECGYVPPTLGILHEACDIDTGNIPDGIEQFDPSLIWWHKQGVLMINAALTVMEGEGARDHVPYWEFFIKAILEGLDEKRKNLAFIFMGLDAQKFFRSVFPMKHLVLKPCHPAATARYRGKGAIPKAMEFSRYRIFTKTNQYLQEHNIDPINWYNEGKGNKES